MPGIVHKVKDVVHDCKDTIKEKIDDVFGHDHPEKLHNLSPWEAAHERAKESVRAPSYFPANDEPTMSQNVTRMDKY
ncbi:unnamed protein product, partial [Mesorhabditis spiculigera]